MPKRREMTSAETQRFIERTLANTAAINAATAELGKETRQLLNDYIRESQAYIAESRAFTAESRERTKRLEANLDELVRALRPQKNGKK
jgi:hypothetical protein